MNETKIKVGDFVTTTGDVPVTRGLFILHVTSEDVLRVTGEYGGVCSVVFADKDAVASDAAAYFGEFYVESEKLRLVPALLSSIFSQCD